MEELAVRTYGLTRTFGAVRAVDSLDLDVPAGAIFGLIGPNGAGKSTVIRLLLGLLKPSSGQATVLGFDAATQGDQIRTRAGALLEPCSLYERLSALDNLDFYGRIWRMSAANRRARARELLVRLDLWEHRYEPVQGWSRDLKQRLCIARALFHRPDLVLIDEPAAGLDPVAARAVQRDLVDLAAGEGTTVLFTTNDLSQAEALCTHVALMQHGVLLAAGAPAELSAHGAAPRVEIIGRGFTDEVVALLARRPEIAGIRRLPNGLALDLTGNVDTAPLVSLLVESSADIEEVRKHPASLQSAFMALVHEPCPPENRP